MSVAKIAQGKLTSQQIADFMLAADRDRRAALKRNDVSAAVTAQIETDKLAKLLEV